MLWQRGFLGGFSRGAMPLSFGALKRLDEIRIKFVLSFDAWVHKGRAVR